MISISFWIIAVLCCSSMDTVDHHQSESLFSLSLFKNQLWWNSDQGWRNKYIDRDVAKGRVKWIFGLDKPVFLMDAWHFFKLLMILSLVMSVVTFKPWDNILITISIYVITWWIVFEGTYKYLFIKKTYK